MNAKNMKSRFSRNWRLPPTWSRFLIVILLLLGVYFRFVNLERKTYWHDEVYTSLRVSGYTEAELVQQVVNSDEISIKDLQKYQRINSEKGLVDTIKGLAQEEPQLPPLYYILVRFWVQWFGDSVAVTRSFSAVISLLAFPCLYWLCLELFESSLTGWIAASLMAVSPFYVLYAQEARHYSLWIVTILLSSASLLRAMRLKTKLSWGMYAISLVLGLYTFMFSGLVAISHGIYVVVTERLRLSKTVVAFMLASVAALLAFAPWILVVTTNLSATQSSTAWLSKDLPLLVMVKFWIYQSFSPIFADFWNSSNFFPDLYFRYLNFGRYLSLPLLILTGYSFYFLYHNAPQRAWLFILTLIGVIVIVVLLPDLILGGRRSIIPRYLIPFYLGVQLAVAYLFATQIMAFSSSTRQQKWQIITLATVSVGVLSCVISSQADTWWNKLSNEKNHQIAHIINQSTHPLLISDSEIGYVVSLSYLLDSKVRLVLTPAIGGTESNIPTIAESFSDIFLFDSPYHFKIWQTPENTLRYRLAKKYNYKIKPAYQEGGLWRIEK